jgi:hypothetical protein
MSTVIKIMANALQREIVACGEDPHTVTLAVCEAIMAAVLEETGKVAEKVAAMTQEEFEDNLKRST